MPTEVKICGLSEEESVDAALEAGADFVGFVFFPPSPRNVAIDRAAALAKRARGKAGIVALTVDADDASLPRSAETLRPDLLQLHGSETPERVAAVRGADRPRRHEGALGRERATTLPPPSAIRSAERFLIDAKPPKDATRPGGNAVAFDWSILEGFAPAKPWLLAGGLNPENVAAALSADRRARRRRLLRRGKRAGQEGRRADPRLRPRRRANTTRASARCSGSRSETITMNVPQPNTYRSGPDERGRFGLYGGRFVAETLMPLVLELEQAYEAAKNDPAFEEELTVARHALYRAAEPALFRRAADGASSRSRGGVRPQRRRQDLLQARRAQSHRQPQDQQLPRPDPARAAHGEDAHHRGDRRRPARRRRRHGMRALRLSLRRLYGRDRHRAAEAERLPHEAPRRRGRFRSRRAPARSRMR